MKASSAPLEPGLIINVSDLNTKDGQSSGGQTGSTQVKDEFGSLYQFKPSITEANPLRQAKALRTEKENISEFIAALVSRKLLEGLGGTKELIPRVSLVVDHGRQKLAIASKYLSEVETLDGFIDSQEKAHSSKGSARTREGRHWQIVNRPLNAKDSGAYSISSSGDKNQALRYTLCLGFLVSALSGDHDVNPGNFMVYPNGMAARIDFGHAFNDLIQSIGTTAFGGGQVVQESRIKDFFVRESLAGIGEKSKFIRDYDGLLQSPEMRVAAANLLNEDVVHKLNNGLTEVKAAFQDILLNDTEVQAPLKKKILDSLIKVADDLITTTTEMKVMESSSKPLRQLSEKELTEESIQQILDGVFDRITAFYLIGVEDMVKFLAITGKEELSEKEKEVSDVVQRLIGASERESGTSSGIAESSASLFRSTSSLEATLASVGSQVDFDILSPKSPFSQASSLPSPSLRRKSSSSRSR